MSPSALEAFLVVIYANSAARARFKVDPYGEAKRAGLSDNECAALLKMDWVGLDMASHSFARKRHTKHIHSRPSPFTRAWHSLLHALKLDL